MSQFFSGPTSFTAPAQLRNNSAEFAAALGNMVAQENNKRTNRTSMINTGISTVGGLAGKAMEQGYLPGMKGEGVRDAEFFQEAYSAYDPATGQTDYAKISDAARRIRPTREAVSYALGSQLGPRTRFLTNKDQFKADIELSDRDPQNPNYKKNVDFNYADMQGKEGQNSQYSANPIIKEQPQAGATPSQEMKSLPLDEVAANQALMPQPQAGQPPAPGYAPLSAVDIQKNKQDGLAQPSQQAYSVQQKSPITGGLEAQVVNDSTGFQNVRGQQDVFGKQLDNEKKQRDAITEQDRTEQFIGLQNRTISSMGSETVPFAGPGGTVKMSAIKNQSDFPLLIESGKNLMRENPLKYEEMKTDLDNMGTTWGEYTNTIDELGKILKTQGDKTFQVRTSEAAETLSNGIINRYNVSGGDERVNARVMQLVNKLYTYRVRYGRVSGDVGNFTAQEQKDYGGAIIPEILNYNAYQNVKATAMTDLSKTLLRGGIKYNDERTATIGEQMANAARVANDQVNTGIYGNTINTNPSNLDKYRSLRGKY
jgi:hypothetical protein